ncbi:MAG: dTMP kinase [Acidobacteriota bacterium]
MRNYVFSLFFGVYVVIIILFMMKLKKGILIVFEGIDGSGKTTQAEIMLKKLKERGFDAVLFREPSNSYWGKKIKELSKKEFSLSPEEELECFLKDRKFDVENNIKPALKNKKIVLLDRYYFSNIAYQGAKGIDKKKIERLNKKIAIKPDLVIILDIEPETGLKRVSNVRKFERLFEKEDFLKKVRENFLSFKANNIKFVNGSKTIKEIYSEIEDIVFRLIKNREDK